jgi:hypothetical protein
MTSNDIRILEIAAVAPAEILPRYHHGTTMGAFYAASRRRSEIFTASILGKLTNTLFERAVGVLVRRVGRQEPRQPTLTARTRPRRATVSIESACTI